MRKIVLTIIVAGWPALALAEQPSRYISGKSNSAGKKIKLKGALHKILAHSAGRTRGQRYLHEIGGYVARRRPWARAEAGWRSRHRREEFCKSRPRRYSANQRARCGSLSW
jgi:hypothetical protein